MSVIKEFKEFAIKGNLIDMAIGVVIGTAFGKVVSAFIDGMVMPLIGMISGGIDLSDAKIVLKDGIPATAGSAAVPEVAVNYGNFISETITFLVVALVVFAVVKMFNKMRKAQEEAAAAAPAPSSTDVLLAEIRDELRRRN
ncbi:MAG TPA: large-conductance mechanosensitive channel protein MscL [Saprospiraceae bacterium]|mgnify:CR=1 FL=1|nr:large-conductance mechanosensitive channel protein MscL [Saprospiraceae bacterium]HQW56083.1 large-conductance mechanosensitive channel protein MscL [Saprospiraceae bacterium]